MSSKQILEELEKKAKPFKDFREDYRKIFISNQPTTERLRQMDNLDNELLVKLSDIKILLKTEVEQ